MKKITVLFAVLFVSNFAYANGNVVRNYNYEITQDMYGEIQIGVSSQTQVYETPPVKNAELLQKFEKPNKEKQEKKLKKKKNKQEKNLKKIW